MRSVPVAAAQMERMKRTTRATERAYVLVTIPAGDGSGSLTCEELASVRWLLCPPTRFTGPVPRQGPGKRPGCAATRSSRLNRPVRTWAETSARCAHDLQGNPRGRGCLFRLPGYGSGATITRSRLHRPIHWWLGNRLLRELRARDAADREHGVAPASAAWLLRRRACP